MEKEATIVQTSSETSSKTATRESSEDSKISEETLTKKFEAKDVSDETIESIRTYNDYLTMYELIVNDYVTHYEAAVSKYGLGDSSTYQQMRDEVIASTEEQKKQYGAMGETLIVGRKELIEFLKEYRDTLREYVNSLSAALGG